MPSDHPSDLAKAHADKLCKAIQRGQIGQVTRVADSDLTTAETIGFLCSSIHGSRHLTALHYAVETPASLQPLILEAVLDGLHHGCPQLEHLGEGEIRRQKCHCSKGPTFLLEFEQYTPLCWAALHANVDAVERLLAKGADVNSRASSKSTSALLAVCSRADESEIDRDIKTINILLFAGADVDAADDEGCTAVHYLLSRRMPQLSAIIMKLLHKIETSVNTQNKYGWTLLHCIAYYVQEESEAAEMAGLSISKGANVFLTARNGMTPPQLAHRYQSSRISERFDKFRKQKLDSDTLQLDVRPKKRQFTEQEAELLRNMYTSNYKRHKARISERSPGTCEWILSHPQFLSWDRTDDSSLLWVSADPGCGKSVLASYLIDYFRSDVFQATRPCNICYCFFKDDNDEQKRAEPALCMILHQLYNSAPNTIHHLEENITSKGNSLLKDIYSLWTTFSNSAHDQASGHTICVMDALDECEESSRNELMTLIARDFQHLKLQRSSQNESSLKIVITSRPYRSIEDKLYPHPIIRLRGENETNVTNHDIALMVEQRVRGFGHRRGISINEQDTLIQRITQNANATFIWASLVLDDIEASLKISKKTMERLLSDIPHSMDFVYEKILNRVQNKENARRMLHIVLGAMRPLDTTEINHAFHTGPECQRLSDIDLEPQSNIENFIRNTCGLFVKIVSSKVYLIHQTAKEFLIARQDGTDPNPDIWKCSFRSIDSHHTVLEICLSYLYLTNFGNLMEDSKEGLFFEYAARYWPVHFKLIQHQVTNQLLQCILELYRSEPKRLGPWFKIFHGFSGRLVPQYLENLSQSEMSCFLGHDQVLRALSHQEIDWIVEGNVSLLLGLATMKGHIEVIKLLLERGADTLNDTLRDPTPLILAVRGGHEEAVRLLLQDRRTDVNSVPDFGDTALCSAVTQFNVTMVEILLKEGKADVKVPCRRGESALHHAVESGQDDMVKLLLEHDESAAFLELENGETLLHYAVTSQQESMMRLILDTGVDVERRDHYGKTALDRVVGDSYYQEGIVRSLLDRGAISSLEHVKCAVEYGDDATASYLVRRLPQDAVGAILLSPNTSHDLLHNAAQEDYPLTAMQLIQKGFDCNYYHNGFTPLHTAALWGSEDVVKTLLQAGSDVEAKNPEGKTALHIAYDNKDDVLVQLLLQAGASMADVDSSWAMDTVFLNK